MKTQKGSAHAFLILGLVVALTGALGFIFWQNFIMRDNQSPSQAVTPKEPASKSSAEEKPENSTFKNETVTFEYPLTGWKEKKSETTYDNSDEIARIETDDFKPHMGIGLESGAQIDLRLTENTSVPQIHGVSKVREITVEGKKGHAYDLEYEGYRQQAVFTAQNENGYALTMQTTESPTKTERDAFSLVLESIKFL